MPKSRRKRQSYTSDKRVSILQSAQKDNLTALQVKKRYGVTPVTYYSWRRKYGAAGRRITTVARARGRGLERQVRSEVQTRVRQILPGIVRNEVSHYLDSLFGSSRGRARRV